MLASSALLHPPLPSDRVAAERARTLHFILIASTFVLCGMTVLGWLFASRPSHVMITYALLGAMNLSQLILLAVGRWRLAAILHSVMHLVVVIGAMATLGGLYPQAAFVLPPIVLVAGLTWNGRAAIGMAIAGSLAGLALIVLEAQGLLPTRENPTSTTRIWLAMTGALVMTAAIVYAALRVLQRSADDAALHAGRARELVNGAPDAMLFVDPRGAVSGVNPAACELIGLPERSIVGRTWQELPIFGQANPAALEAHLSSPDQAQGPLLLEVCAARGRRAAVELRVRPVRSEDDRECLHLTLRDVTERLDAQAQERALAEQLEASRRLEAIGRLAAGVAHDFNNLLTVILGQVDLLPRYDPKVDESARVIEESALRAAELTRGLLAVGGKRWLSPESVDLSERVRLLEPMMRGLMRGQIELRLSLEAEVPLVRMDRSQLDQVILNLVVNARDALARGGHIEIATSVRHEPSPEGERRFTQLTVTDDGVGIPVEIRDRIFEPFFTTKAEGQGTGLGLATVQGVVTQSGGRVEVESRPGGGTRFTVLLPQSGKYTEMRRAPLPRRPAFGRILLIEEEPEVRRVAVASLRSAGHRVEVADGAMAALQAARGRQELDLVVADVQRLGLSATELARRLRCVHPRLKILICSAYAPDDLHADEVDLQLISKPYNRAELLEAVQRLLAENDGDDPADSMGPPASCGPEPAIGGAPPR